MAPIGQHLIERRARQHAALRARMALADRVVIGVEEIAVRRVEDAVAPHLRREHESLEEPRGMRQMPFRGTGIGHRLDRRILRRKRRNEA
jgi:hypothetical protein